VRIEHRDDVYQQHAAQPVVLAHWQLIVAQYSATPHADHMLTTKTVLTYYFLALCAGQTFDTDKVMLMCNLCRCLHHVFVT